MGYAVGETPLHSACIKGDLAAVETLLEQGADINTVDNAGNALYKISCFPTVQTVV